MGPLDRVPEARLLRALWLSNNWGATRGNQRFEDDLTYTYAKFLAELRSGLGFMEQERYLSLKPVLAQVYWLISSAADWRSMYQSDPKSLVHAVPQGSNGDYGLAGMLQQDRTIIRALILAGSSTEFISLQTSYPKEVIEIYEKLAWDIRGRAQARAWVHNFIFPRGIQVEAAPLDFERLLFQRAYAHGIEGVLDYLHLAGHISEPKEYSKRQNSRNVADLTHKTTSGIQIMKYTQGSTPELIQTAAATDKNDRELELKEGEAKKKDQAKDGDIADRMMKGLTTAGERFQPLDPTVPCEEGAEERLDDTDFRKALATAKAEVNLVGADT